jgi:hypothetical protein
VHGNEVDAWNVTDHEAIRRIGKKLTHGRAMEPWVPNAGTQLVVDVMNSIKKTYPFVDLLKPETNAVLPALLALDPRLLGKAQGAVSTLRRKAWDATRMATGFLHAEEGKATEPMPEVGADWRKPEGLDLGPVAGKAGTGYAYELMDRAEKRLVENVDPLTLVDRDKRTEYLGYGLATWKLVRGSSPREVLREALEKLDDDRSFDPAYEDETYRDIDALIGPEIDFVVTGHTHLERALRRRNGTGYYYNGGTWARLMRLPPEVRNDQSRFDKFFALLGTGQLPDLDAEPGVLLDKAPVVSIWKEGSTTCGELRHVTAPPADLLFEPMPDSRFVRS